MKKFFGIALLFTLFLSFSSTVLASRSSAIEALKQEYMSFGLSDEQEAGTRATQDVDSLIAAMDSDKNDVKVAADNMSAQVEALPKNSSRRDPAVDAFEGAEGVVEDFTGLDSQNYIRVESSIAGSLPYVAPDNVFTDAKRKANQELMKVRQIMLAPDRPGNVPSGDIVSDFIPQIIRQLFRFAWLLVLVSLTVSGVYFVMAQHDDDRLTKAKTMIYYSLIGFAFIALAFAIVKGVTDIDFFRFI